MGRIRKTRKDLPQRCYCRHNAYYFVDYQGKWLRLGKTLSESLRHYSTIINGGLKDIRTMGQVMDRYLLEVLPEFKPATIAIRKGHIERLRRVFGDMRPGVVKPMHLARYRDERARKSGKVAANMEISTFSAVFSKCVEWGFLNLNPCKQIKRLRQPARDRYMTDEEFVLLRENADELIQCVMDVGYLSGLRLGDILKLRRSDIKGNELHVTTQKTGKKLIFTIEGDLEAALARAKALTRPILSDYLFCVHSGKQISQNTFTKKFVRLKKRVGLHDSNLHFHDIRSKAATDAQRAGLDAQRLLGHKTRNQTDHYVKQRQVDKVTPLSFFKKGQK